MKTAPCGVVVVAFLLLATAGPVWAQARGLLWDEISALGGVLEGPERFDPDAECVQAGKPSCPDDLCPMPKNPNGTTADCYTGLNIDDPQSFSFNQEGIQSVAGEGFAAGNLLQISLNKVISNDTVVFKLGLDWNVMSRIDDVPAGEFCELATSINLYLENISCPQCLRTGRLRLDLAGAFPGVQIGAKPSSLQLSVITANKTTRTSNSFTITGDPKQPLETTPLAGRFSSFSLLVTLSAVQYDLGTTAIKSTPGANKPPPFDSFDPRDSDDTDPQGIAPLFLPPYPLHPLPPPPAIAGLYVSSSGATEGFGMLPNGTIEAPIVDPHDTLRYTAPAGVNDAGTIVGTYENTTPVGEKGALATFHGFLRTAGGKFATYDYGKGLSTALEGINDNGDVTGVFGSNTVVNQGFFLPKGGRPTAFGVSGFATFPQALNDTDTVIGLYVDAGSHDHGFEWTPKHGLVAFDYPGAADTVPRGINDAGTISGYFADAAGTLHGFYGGLGQFTQYDLGGVADTLPSGINDAGIVTGSFNRGDGKRHGFVAQLCAVDQSSRVRIALGQINFDKKTREYEQKVTLTNTGDAVINGPIDLLFENLPRGAFPANGTGFSSCLAPQAPYITVVPSGSTLGPGHAVSVTVDFVDRSKATITYTPAVVAGTRV